MVRHSFGAHSALSNGAGRFWGNQTFAEADLKDRLWVGSRHGSELAANGDFTPLLENC